MIRQRASKAQAAIELPSGATARPTRPRGRVGHLSVRRQVGRLLGQAAIESSCGSTACRLRAQAAMEYLVTYGWALLVLFVVVAYLLTSGAFSASSFAAQECVFQPDLHCSPFVLYTESGATVLQFTITNGLGFPIKISGINYTTTGIGASGRKVYPGSVPGNAIPSGARMNFTGTFPGSPQPSANDFRTTQRANTKGFPVQDCHSSPRSYL